MCHLVSWKATPRSDAGVSILQTEVFVDQDDKTGYEVAIEFAEGLATREGSKDIQLWKLIGEAAPKTFVEWTKKES